jgi:hypothetical protein
MPVLATGVSRDRACRAGEAGGRTPTLFLDGVVHRGSHDAATLIEALA